MGLRRSAKVGREQGTLAVVFLLVSVEREMFFSFTMDGGDAWCSHCLLEIVGMAGNGLAG